LLFLQQRNEIGIKLIIKVVTMDILHIIAVVALVVIGGVIYWNKTRG
jgi:hypothetical protein